MQSVFGRLLASILEGLGVICWGIFLICGVTLSMRPRKWKMWFGLIICYESSTWAFADTGGKSHKICEFWRSFLGRPLGRHFGAFLASFGSRFGTILGAKWPKKAIQKSTEKKVRKKSCGCLQVFVTLGAAVPLRSYNRRVGGSFNTLQSLHSVPCGHGGGFFCARQNRNGLVAGPVARGAPTGAQG